MRWVDSIKKIAIIIVIALLAFDVSLIFAAEGDATQSSAAPVSSVAPAPDAEAEQQQSLLSGRLQHLFQRQTVNLPGGDQPKVVKLRENPLPSTPGPSQLRGLESLSPAGLGRAGLQKPLTAEQLLARAEAIRAMREQAEARLRAQAFSNMRQKAFPMTPSEIQTLHKQMDDTQRATAASAVIPPKPVSTSLVVNLSPGVTPPVIRLSQGFVSSLVFVDSTGAPWPIQSYDIGNPKVFDIQWNKTSNTLMVQALEPYTYGNMAVKLLNLNTPVMLTLTPGQREVDYRVDLRVQGIGPKANVATLHDGMPKQANPSLLSILNGVPPAGSHTLQVVGGYYTQAWMFGDKVFVRTRHRILSPGWMATMSSADGTHAYELPKTSMILVSQHGKVVPIRFEQAG